MQVNTRQQDIPYKGSTQFWDCYSTWYEKWIEENCFHSRVWREIKGRLQRGHAVLDIGGGSGVLALPMARRVKSVTVVEPSSQMVANLEQRIAGYGLNNLISIQQRWEEVDSGILDQYDWAVMCNSIYWTANLPAFLDKAAAVCRLGLIVVVDVAQNKSKIKEINRRFKDNSDRPRRVYYDLIKYAQSRNYCLQTSVLSFPSRYLYRSLEEAVEHWRILLHLEPERVEELSGVLAGSLEQEGEGYVFREDHEAAVIYIGLNPDLRFS